MKVMITGAAGQLGLALRRSAPKEVELTTLDRTALDITDGAAVGRCLDAAQPAVLINAAAFTAVDQAESQREQAFAINADAVALLARASAERQVRLVHISTDFVFEGSSSRPYRPDDPPGPLSVYGASKLAGERQIAAQNDLDWRIIRTAWVYASAGRNFLVTMLRLCRERERIEVVADQVGTPTSAGSLAHCVWRTALDDGQSGVLHFTDAGVASRYDFAVAIYEEARTLGLLQHAVELVPIGSEQYPTPARRPAYSVLDTRSTLARLSVAPVHWRVVLREVLKELRP
jgi:dTDP-4-dehydrorhamnose reductase